MATGCYTFIFENPETGVQVHGFVLASSVRDLFWRIDELTNPYSAKIRKVSTDMLLTISMQTFTNKDDEEYPYIDWEPTKYPRIGESLDSTIYDSLNHSLRWRRFKDENTLVNFPVKKGGL